MMSQTRSIADLRKAILHQLLQAEEYERLAMAAVNHASRAHFTQRAESYRQMATTYQFAIDSLRRMSVRDHEMEEMLAIA